jgi:hypothetical protein
MPHARAVETAAQVNQVLRTEDRVGFEPTFAALSEGFIPAGSVATACRNVRAVETAAQFNQVLRTEDGVGFEPTFAALSKGFIPADVATACRMPARLKPLLRSTKSCGLKTESVSNRLSQI